MRKGEGGRQRGKRSLCNLPRGKPCQYQSRPLRPSFLCFRRRLSPGPALIRLVEDHAEQSGLPEHPSFAPNFSLFPTKQLPGS
jgi:hypothetical protein